MSFVEIDAVDLRYRGAGGDKQSGDLLALSNASLTIAAGEFAAVVGPSGCGKSTLLKLVAGLVRPTRGRVSARGEEIRRPLQKVGMAFQNPTLLPWRSILDNVLLPLEIVEPFRSEQRRNRTQHRDRAENLLRSVGLRGFAERMPWQLSGGMQQRAQLCRALIHDPEILLLDEPFGALDAFTREELWGVLQALWMQRKCTVILVTHELREAAYLADTVHVMCARPGRVIATYPVPLSRPRTLETTFAPEFVDLVHELRGKIARVPA
jgi:NitT/TauT family transport system ATP-binding protein